MSDDELSGAIATALRRANPVPMERVAGRRSARSADALFNEITAQSPRRERPRRVVALAVVVGLFVATFAAFAVVRRDDATTGTPTVCYGAQSLNSDNRVAGFGDPSEVCAQLWRDGVFGDQTVLPHFDECVLPSGGPGVFPGESGTVCAKLGLPALNVPELEARIQKFTTEAGALVEEHCIGDAQARSIVVRELDKLGLNDWTVAHNPKQPYTDESPCASIFTQPESHQVFLVPVGPAHPSDSVPR